MIYWTRLAFVSIVIFAIGMAEARANGFDRAAFDKFVSDRAGDGEPIYWYSIGTIRSYPAGDLLFEMEGYDTARRHTPDPSKAKTEQYNRKIYFYKNAETGEYIKEWGGEAVEPIAYPYQFITYELIGDQIETHLEQGAEPRITKFGPSRQISARRLGDTLVVTAPVYIDFPIPNSDRRIDAFENYDFFLQGSDASEPHQLSWVRYGDLPGWAAAESSTGKAIYHLITWRVEDFNDLPAGIRAEIEESHPLWKQPPASLSEVRALQSPDSDEKESKGF